MIKPSRKFEKQTRYLSQASQLEESVNPSVIRMTMITVSLAIIAFLGWAALTNINEVARTSGEVVPQGYQQVVQHLEGGIVKEIKVQESQTVQKGQILMVIDGAGAKDDLARALTKQASLTLQEERLRAFAEKRTPSFVTYKKDYPELVKDQEKFFMDMLTARDEEAKIVREQITQKQRVIATLQSDLQTARNSQSITKDLYHRRQSLNEKGYTSDVKFLETKQTLNAIDGEIHQLNSRIAVAQAEIGEFQSRLRSLEAGYHDEANERLDRILAEKAQNAELIDKLQDRVERLAVKAPVSGLVKGLAVNTVGAVIQPGQTLMEVVPDNEQLVVQVKIPPQHIGHVHRGQPVQVKFSSFDFSRYGVVPGQVDQISATTFSGEQGERYYRGRINLDRLYVGNDPRNVIMPGMTIMAEIITGEKTVLDYLLKPIHVAMKTAFTER